ncbi:hypothetical protein PHMEG_0001746 [Phytophthora megakarya]|uniref:Uncharacterized protein n=1 Tax=Phytophthora megakarya TaxID=4795 RepID=A0A225X0C4_9STRA|nr:hypothetical protein PHMEG_0001746 [Phytophthora megakarya]
MSDQANYAKWRGSDRNSGKTKEALLGEILEQLEKTHIKHRDRAGVREKISSIEKQYREAEDFLKGTGAGITNERDLNALFVSCVRTIMTFTT